MRNGRVLGAALAGVCLLGVVGCDETVDGTATAPTTTVRDIDEIEVYNPCTELSADVLRATGVDPASKRTVTDPPSGPASWRVCSWYPEGDAYVLTVLSSSHTLDETRAKDTVTDLREATVNGRTGLVFREKSLPTGCYVAFEAEQGMFEVFVDWLMSDQQDSDTCAMANKHATDLEPHLPN
ncbi:DUF3558 domain-containing protein [Nocardia sp. NPDC056064]|uniref:DUF3558 domain-containing protein n=1 Tax=Nocardia sp. NPDC056064 TaxID=3345701 RepID=UPI0035E21648